MLVCTFWVRIKQPCRHNKVLGHNLSVFFRESFQLISGAFIQHVIGDIVIDFWVDMVGPDTA
jgi:hypothetical protein